LRTITPLFIETIRDVVERAGNSSPREAVANASSAARRHRRTELGWSAIRVVDPDGIGEAEMVVYCANCLAREFGGLLLWLTGARAGHSRSS
jgi:hypothetical protein